MDLQRLIKRLMHRAHEINGRVFRERKILIVSENSIISIPLRPRLQQCALAATLCVMVWSFYSNGRFVAYQGLIAQKEIEVIRSNMENRELQQLYESMQTEMGSLNGFMDEIKKNASVDQQPKPKAGKVKQEESKAAPLEAQPISFNKVPQRSIQEIRYKTELARASMHEKIVDYTRRVENNIASTGLDLDTLLKKTPAAKLRSKVQGFSTAQVSGNSDEGMGGPLIPVSYSSKNRTTTDEMQTRFQYLLELTRVMNTLPVGRPIKRLHVTSPFGVRTDPFTENEAIHSGIDIQDSYGANVYATAPGKVTFAGRFGAYGNCVEINHGRGIVSRYGHLKEVKVRQGEKVERYSIIGAQGNTGRSSGTHVHYEVRVNDRAVNPEPFLKAGGHVLK